MRGLVTADGSGLSGVACSDGRSVVRTDADGSFELDVSGPFVFVTTPSGYATERWFTAADGEPRFDLHSVEQPVPFSFAQITDLHLAFDGWVFGEPVAATPAVTASLFDEVASRPGLSFVVCTGDETNNGTDDEFVAYLQAAARCDLPVVAIPGNHDHNSVDIALARDEGKRFGPDVLYTPYDRHLGPRWFSFDHGGVHFVALDWTTYHLGVEREVQEAWVRADLACVVRGTPVVFLTHDLMPSSFFDGLDGHVVASFSGHWHTSRVVEADRVLHVNTAPATFGGLDYSPAHWRIATWDGARITVETVRREDRAREPSGSLWTTRLGGAVSRGGPVVSGDLVLATSGDESRAMGHLEAFDVETGARRWGVEFGSAVKSQPIVVGGRAIAVAVTGETVCVDVESGEVLWRSEIDDPLRLWTYLRPASDGERVFVGDTARFVALDLASGDVVWSRDDLGVRGNITCHAYPVVVDGVVIASFAAQVPDIWALDAVTGETRWPQGIAAANIYDLGAEEVMAHMPRTPVSAFAADPDGSDVYVVRLSNAVDRLRVSDGSVVWSTPIAGWFNPAALVVDGDEVFVCEGRGVLWCLGRADGAVRWRTEVTTSSPVHMGPYRNSGGALFGEAVVADEDVVVACGDGRLVTLARADGAIRSDRLVGGPFASAPALSAGLCFTADIAGVLRATRRET